MPEQSLTSTCSWMHLCYTVKPTILGMSARTRWVRPLSHFNPVLFPFQVQLLPTLPRILCNVANVRILVRMHSALMHAFMCVYMYCTCMYTAMYVLHYI